MKLLIYRDRRHAEVIVFGAALNKTKLKMPEFNPNLR